MALLFSRSQRYVSSHGAFMFSFSCAAVGMLIVALSSSFAGVVTGMVVFGFGLGWFVPNLMTAAAKHVTLERQGRTTGLIKAAHYLAAPTCVLLAEPVTRQIGPRGAMWIVFVIALGLLGAFICRITTRDIAPRASTHRGLI